MHVRENSGSVQPLCRRCKEINLLDWMRQDIPPIGDMDLTSRELGLGQYSESWNQLAQPFFGKTALFAVASLDSHQVLTHTAKKRYSC